LPRASSGRASAPQSSTFPRARCVARRRQAPFPPVASRCAPDLSSTTSSPGCSLAMDCRRVPLRDRVPPCECTSCKSCPGPSNRATTSRPCRRESRLSGHFDDQRRSVFSSPRGAPASGSSSESAAEGAGAPQRPGAQRTGRGAHRS
jgi:hypothetical protein